ncbi:urotensin 2 domain containing precursor [Labeo rohita]|uniref:Urotensin 2 domain containing n=1 Tax=Labeo rohita TaxID=84645 RepID=A0A498MGH7_LABRO|nr:urotensin 2 domain containing precursor [Labeo rohita]
MDRPSSGSLLPRLAFLLLIGALNVHTRSLASPVNQVFHSKDDSDIQNQILAFLLRKNIMPVPEKDVIGLELARKIAELQEPVFGNTVFEDLKVKSEEQGNLQNRLMP